MGASGQDLVARFQARLRQRPDRRAAGARPAIGQHWTARIAQGTDILHKHAIDGYTGPDGGVMPPKGGNPALTDEQVIATVDWMLGQLK